MSVAKLISPGVFTKENDLSFVPAGTQAIGASLVGLTQKGPAFVPTQIFGFNEFRDAFGNLDTKLYTPYAAKNYLANAGTLTVTRVLSDTTKNIGNPLVLAFGTGGQALSGTSTAMAVLRFRTDSGTLTGSVSGIPSNFSICANSIMVSNLSLDKTSPNYVKKVLGIDPVSTKSGDLLPALYVDAVFDYAYSNLAGVTVGSISAGNTLNQFIGGYFTAQTPNIVSQNYNGTVFDLFNVVSRSDGDASNYDVKISILVDQSQVSVSSYPYFTLFVRDFDDIDNRPVILESFRCNLDPTSNSFIGKVIGDRYPTIDNSTDPSVIKWEGNFPNNSKFIRVVTQNSGDNPLYPSSAKPSGFRGIPSITAGNTFAQIPYKTDHISTLTNAKNDKVYMGVDTSTDGLRDRIKGSNTVVSGSKANDFGLLIYPISSEYVNAAGTATLASTFVQVPSWAPGSQEGTSGYGNALNTYQKIAFSVPLYGGSDGFDPRQDKRELTNGSLSTEYNYILSLLANADEYDFNLIALPGINAGNAANGGLTQRVIDMVSDRGDAFYIMDIADSTINSTSGAVDSTINGVISVAGGFDTSYAATYFPWVRILDTDNQKLVWVPPSVDVIGVYAFNDKVGQQFFAPAGFNRGIMSAVEARYRLNITQRDSLYSAKVNPIATFSGQGPVVWGQKTLQTRASALDRVNVRRLLILAKKLIASVAKYFAFEPNTAAVRDALVNQINPILKRIQEKQGIDEFRVVIDESNNTPDIIDRNTLIGAIYIKPTRTAEILVFEFNILRTGATLFES